MAKSNQASAVPELSPARQMLKQSLEALQRSLDVERKAGEVVEAASAEVERARAEVSSFAELEEDIVKSRLAALKGQEGTKSPEQIREDRRKRMIAREELHAADETLQVARRELEESRGNVARCQKLCASHATSVISERLRGVVELLAKVSLERERLRTILKAMILPQGEMGLLLEDQRMRVVRETVTAVGLPCGDPTDWLRIRNTLMEDLTIRYEPQDPGPGLARAVEYWKSFADSILADPAAEQLPLPSVEKLWS